MHTPNSRIIFKLSWIRPQSLCVQPLQYPSYPIHCISSVSDLKAMDSALQKEKGIYGQGIMCQSTKQAKGITGGEYGSH